MRFWCSLKVNEFQTVRTCLVHVQKLIFDWNKFSLLHPFSLSIQYIEINWKPRSNNAYYLSMCINYKKCIFMALAVENCIRLNAKYNDGWRKKWFVVLFCMIFAFALVQNVRQLIKIFCSFTFRHSCGYFHLNEILLIFECHIVWTWRFNRISYFCFHSCRRFFPLFIVHFFFLNEYIMTIHFKPHLKWDPDYSYNVMVQFVIFPIPRNFTLWLLCGPHMKNAMESNVYFNFWALYRRS